MKKCSFVCYVLLVLLLIVLAIAFYSPTYQPEADHTHYHAGFRVYLGDDLQDYSGIQYMNFTPCSEHVQKKTKAEEQIEKAHLHDGVGDVVHVHRRGAVWGDLFKNIGANLPSDVPWKGYIEGELKQDILSEPITPYTTMVLVVGDSRVSVVGERISKSYIEEVEAKSELCGD